jgi:hypothetical protein
MNLPVSATPQFTRAESNGREVILAFSCSPRHGPLPTYKMRLKAGPQGGIFRLPRHLGLDHEPEFVF